MWILGFLAANAGTIVISALLLAALVLIVRGMYKKTKQGKCASCDGCGKDCGCRTHTQPGGKG